jgi:hypothetical protein
MVMINRGLLFCALIVGCSSPAMACSPPNEAEVTTNDQLFRITKSKIEGSDAIIDAAVDRRRRGETALKPLKVWAGPRLSSYAIINDGCGIFLPENGHKVRVLLQRSGNDWSVIEPVTGSGKAMLKFDGIVDAYLQNVRPKDFKSVGPVLPPMP